MKNRFLTLAIGAALALTAVWDTRAAENSETAVPSIVVHGQASVSAAPDLATAQLGATVQREEAADAQAEVNQIMQKAVSALKKLGIPSAKIHTTGLSLSPVYGSRQISSRSRPDEPSIIGYRASNSVQVETDDMTQIGKIIDAAVAAGANQIQNLSFSLKDDSSQQAQALLLAVRRATAKARTMAEALDVNIASVSEARESQVQTFAPRMEMMAMRSSDMGGGAPVEPGQVKVTAEVTIRFEISANEK